VTFDEVDEGGFPETAESPTVYPVMSFNPENQGLLDWLPPELSNSTGGTSSTSDLDFELGCDDELVTGSVVKIPEKYPSHSYRTWIPSPRGVLHDDLQQKFGAVLSMCKLKFRPKPENLKASD
jgi:hypothetical protein